MGPSLQTFELSAWCRSRNLSSADEEQLHAVFEERDKSAMWKQKYEDLEINRASCCLQMEEDLEEAQETIKQLRHAGQDLMHRLNEKVEDSDINTIAEGQADQWAKEKILKLYQECTEAKEAWKHFQQCFVEEMKKTSALLLELEQLKK